CRGGGDERGDARLCAGAWRVRGVGRQAHRRGACVTLERPRVVGAGERRGAGAGSGGRPPLTPRAGAHEIELLITFDDAEATALAIRNSGEQAVAEAVRDALAPFVGTDGCVSLPACYRAVIARSGSRWRSDNRKI